MAKKRRKINKQQNLQKPKNGQAFSVRFIHLSGCPCLSPKTCINYFQEENYAFNINELQKCCACITRINLMRP